jgi:hypothetical protein
MKLPWGTRDSAKARAARNDALPFIPQQVAETHTRPALKRGSTRIQ